MRMPALARLVVMLVAMLVAMLVIGSWLAGTGRAQADTTEPAPRPTSAPELVPRPQSMVVKHRESGILPALGPSHAPVTIDFFLTLRTRDSLTLHEHLVALASRHPRRLRVVYRFVSEGGDTRMAEAAMEAFAQGKFLPFMDALQRDLDSRLPQRTGSLETACARAGIDFVRIQEAWTSRRHLEVLEANATYRKQRHAQHEPSLLLNGAAPRGLQSHRTRAADLDGAYQDAHAAAARMMGDGVAVEDIYALSLHDIDAALEPPEIRFGAIDGAHGDEVRGPIIRPQLLHQQNLGPGHEIGPSHATVRVLVFCNFGSIYCANLESPLGQLIEHFPGELRLVFHPMFPADVDGDELRGLLSLHRGSLCAEAQGAFWAFYSAAYAVLVERRRQSSTRVAASEQLEAVLSRIDVDRTRFESCMARVEGDDILMEEVRAGQKAGVEYTPTVVVGGRIYPGSKSLLELRDLVEQELAPGLLDRLAPIVRDAPGSVSERSRRDREREKRPGYDQAGRSSRHPGDPSTVPLPRPRARPRIRHRRRLAPWRRALARNDSASRDRRR